MPLHLNSPVFYSRENASVWLGRAGDGASRADAVIPAAPQVCSSSFMVETRVCIIFFWQCVYSLNDSEGRREVKTTGDWATAPFPRLRTVIVYIEARGAAARLAR